MVCLVCCNVLFTWTSAQCVSYVIHQPASKRLHTVQPVAGPAFGDAGGGGRRAAAPPRGQTAQAGGRKRVLLQPATPQSSTYSSKTARTAAG